MNVTPADLHAPALLSPLFPFLNLFLHMRKDPHGWVLGGTCVASSPLYPCPSQSQPQQFYLPAFLSAPLHPRGAKPSASLDPLPGLWHPLVDNHSVPQDWPQNAPLSRRGAGFPWNGVRCPLVLFPSLQLPRGAAH